MSIFGPSTKTASSDNRAAASDDAIFVQRGGFVFLSGGKKKTGGVPLWVVIVAAVGVWFAWRKFSK
jgi:DMSO reductase anchor subunit